MEGDNICVALYQIALLLLYNCRLCLKDSIERPVLYKEFALRRVYIFCNLLVVVEPSASKGNGLASNGVPREYHAVEIPVVEFSGALALQA